jgi:hypothetical protein
MPDSVWSLGIGHWSFVSRRGGFSDQPPLSRGLLFLVFCRCRCVRALSRPLVAAERLQSGRDRPPQCDHACHGHGGSISLDRRRGCHAPGRPNLPAEYLAVRCGRAAASSLGGVLAGCGGRGTVRVRPGAAHPPRKQHDVSGPGPEAAGLRRRSSLGNARLYRHRRPRGARGGSDRSPGQSLRGGADHGSVRKYRLVGAQPRAGAVAPCGPRGHRGGPAGSSAAPPGGRGRAGLDELRPVCHLLHDPPGSDGVLPELCGSGLVRRGRQRARPGSADGSPGAPGS